MVRPVALVTGAGRVRGIGAAIAERLAATGWDVAVTFWPAYDARMPWGSRSGDVDAIRAAIESHGARSHAVEADLVDVAAPSSIFDSVEGELGTPRALILSHCESVDSSIADTTVESFDRHYAVNVRASWLLIGEMGRRFRDPFGSGRIISLTSDHVVGNVPYGATKAALDRVTLAAARELSALGITANVVNPGPTDTGWMSDDMLRDVAARTPLARVGMPADAANLVEFVCSDRGGWVNGQLLCSDGGVHT